MEDRRPVDRSAAWTEKYFSVVVMFVLAIVTFGVLYFGGDARPSGLWFQFGWLIGLAAVVALVALVPVRGLALVGVIAVFAGAAEVEIRALPVFVLAGLIGVVVAGRVRRLVPW